MPSPKHVNAHFDYAVAVDAYQGAPVDGRALRTLLLFRHEPACTVNQHPPCSSPVSSC
jgi:hypothetical protein